MSNRFNSSRITVHERTNDSHKRNRAIREVAKGAEKRTIFKDAPVARELAIGCRVNGYRQADWLSAALGLVL
jgi:hypothetical protein